MSFLQKYTPHVIIRKQDILDYPFEEFAEAELDELEAVADKHKLTQFNTWMLPQLLAHFAKIPLVYTAEGQVDVLATVDRANFRTDKKLRGMFLVATKLPRGALVKKQSSPEWAHYGALVPLFMAAHKKFNGILYRRWSLDQIKYVVDKNLAQAMMVDPDEVPQLEANRLLEIRDQGLMIKGGTRAGSFKNPLTTWSLSGIADTELGHLPKLAQTMLVQTWLAHPSLRNEYMILHPVDWDAMPPPLVNIDIFKDPEPTAEPAKPASKKVMDLPW